MRTRDFDTRLKRLERRRGSTGINPITEALRLRSEEEIISLLVGSELFPRLPLKEAIRIAKEIERESPRD